MISNYSVETLTAIEQLTASGQLISPEEDEEQTGKCSLQLISISSERQLDTTIELFLQYSN